MIRTLTSFILTLTVFATSTTISCKDESGANVDWWVAIKAPKGTDYFYGDSTVAFGPSTHSMNDTKDGALAHTTRQLWTAPTYVMWNDEPPAQPTYNFSYGHTKGYLALDPATNTGILVSHSIPNFAAGPALVPDYAALGSNAYTYAQNVFCMSVSADTLNDVAYRLLLTHPHVYDSAVATGTGGNVTALAAGVFANPVTCANLEFSVGGAGSTTVMVFAKTPAWNADLWAGCVAPALRTDLWVESWIRGSAEGANCTGDYVVLDVQTVAFSDGSWTEYNDHSKWAVSPTGDAICFGDINRMTTQFSRGGAAYCMRDATLAGVFQAASAETNKC
jgi:deoxyribonuclease-2